VETDAEDEVEEVAGASASSGAGDASVCDRLRNAHARVVVLSHSLLGDPAVVGVDAPKKNRDLYFAELDKLCTEQLDRCKLWLGGTQYEAGKQRSVTILSFTCML
jgi:hypothetical protein